MRNIVHNDVYAGQRGYPAIIEPERHARILDGLGRLEPSAVHRRHGGRRPADTSYFLRGVAFCLRCGAALYTREQAVGRVYVCADRRQGSGPCDAPAIPAALIEGHVLAHLDAFVGDAERWIAEQANARNAEQDARSAAAERDRDALAALDRQREQVMAEWRALVVEGDRSAARIVLAEVERGAQAAARRLDISPRTHGANILAKLAVHSQLRAVLFALRRGAVDLR